VVDLPINETKPYESNYHSGDFFNQFRTKIEEFYESERYFLNNDILKPNMTILDIGCASGGLGNAITESIESRVNYLGIDVDEKAIKLGEEKFPKLNLINQSYPEGIKDKKFDMIIVFNLFEQITNWKEFLQSLVDHSNKFINIGLTLRMSGSTVIDKDISYGYYFDSGIRVNKIIHNIYELINFCCLEEMRVKKISFYGYHIDRPASIASDFRPLPQKEQIRGNLLLELFEKGRNKKRAGGFPNTETLKKMNLELEYIFRPNIEIIIDKKPFEL